MVFGHFVLCSRIKLRLKHAALDMQINFHAWVSRIRCLSFAWTKTRWSIYDGLHDLVRLAQFKKREKHPWRSVNVSKVDLLSVFNPNTGKYGPEMTPYLNTFHAVTRSLIDFTFLRSVQAQYYSKMIILRHLLCTTL